MGYGDQYNAYRNDVIDGYESYRKTEHRGSVTQELDEKGILNPDILITRMELANGLAFSPSFENATAVSDLFSDYGQVINGKTKAIRVWSGNDHWLLTLESLKRYCYIIPTGVSVSSNSLFSIIYWTKTVSELEQAINDGSIYTKGYAFLYHDGTASGGGEPVQQVDSLTSPLKKEEEIEEEVAHIVTGTPPETGRKSYPQKPQKNETITIGEWNTIDHAYLKTKPSHKNFANGSDDLRLPLYDGVITLVYKDGTTQDVTTYSDFCYAHSMKELREFERDLTDTDEKYPFDWNLGGAIYNERRVPIILCNPNNPQNKIRALDELDKNIEGETRESYIVCIDSNTMYPPETLQEKFKIESLPHKINLSFTDKIIDITGMKVIEFVSGGETRRYSAEANTLYLKEPTIYDTEMAIANIGEKIKRTVYLMDDDLVEQEVAVLSFPVSTPTTKDMIQISCVAMDTEPISDPSAIGDQLLKTEIALGCRELNTTEELPENRRMRKNRLRNSNSLNNTPIPLLWGSLPCATTCAEETSFSYPTMSYLAPNGDYITKTEEIQIKPGIFKSSKTILYDSVPKGENSWFDVVNQFAPHAARLIANLMVNFEKGNKGNGKIRGLKRKRPANIPANFGWGSILEIGQQVAAPILKKGAKYLLSKILGDKKSTSKYILYNPHHSSAKNDDEFVGEWVESEVTAIPNDIVVVGYDENATTPTQVVKIFSLGQQSLIRLHHSDAVEEDELIGLRCVLPSTETEVEYNQDDVNEILADAQFIPVNGSNEDVPVSENDPYLSIEDGDLVAEPVYYEPGVSSGYIDVEVTTTEQGINKLLKKGLKVPYYLKDSNGKEKLSGFTTLKVRPHQCKTENVNKLTLAQNILSLNSGAVWEYNEPLDSNGKRISASNDSPAIEPEIFLDVSVGSTVIVGSDEDEISKNVMNEASVGIFFDSNMPEGTAITPENLQAFFNTARVSTINENDILEGGDIYDRNYIVNGELDIPDTMGRDLLEFGSATFSWRGKEFLLQEGFINIHNNPENSLVMVHPPEQTVYYYGQRTMNLTGAIFNLINTNTGDVIYEGLTDKNIICEPLPLNVMEIQLEIPDKEEEKTPIQVSFMGYTNQEIKVVLLHPMLAELERQERMRKKGKNIGGGINWNEALATIAPTVEVISGQYFDFLTSFFSKPYKPHHNATWPKDTYELAKQMDINIIICDNFQRRKSFNINDIKRETFEKCCTIEGYNPDLESGIDAQEITIKMLGYKTTSVISLSQPLFTTEDNLNDEVGIIDDEKVYEYDEIPEEIKETYRLSDTPDWRVEQGLELDVEQIQPPEDKKIVKAGVYSRTNSAFGTKRIPKTGCYAQFVEGGNHLGLTRNQIHAIRNQYLRHNSKKTLHMILKENNIDISVILKNRKEAEKKRMSLRQKNIRYAYFDGIELRHPITQSKLRDSKNTCDKIHRIDPTKIMNMLKQKEMKQ